MNATQDLSCPGADQGGFRVSYGFCSLLIDDHLPSGLRVRPEHIFVVHLWVERAPYNPCTAEITSYTKLLGCFPLFHLLLEGIDGGGKLVVLYSITEEIFEVSLYSCYRLEFICPIPCPKRHWFLIQCLNLCDVEPPDVSGRFSLFFRIW